MGKKKRKHSGLLELFATLLIPGAILLSVVLIAVNSTGFFAKNLEVDQNDEQSHNGEYYSKDLQFTSFIPDGYSVKDTGITVVFSKRDKEITIARNGTQFSNIEEYLSDFDSKRGSQVESSKKVQINGLDAIERVYRYQEEEERKSYFIFIESAVYILSTSSKDLYSNLDQIAKSFKYTP